MRIACHYAIPRPPFPELDAAVQDGIRLIETVGGEINFLYPGSRPKKLVPRFLCGLHQLPYLFRLDRQVDLHHIFSNGIYPYPVLRLLTKPIVYTSVIPVTQIFPILTRTILGGVATFVVADRNDLIPLAAAGLPGVQVMPGIDIDRFRKSELERGDTLVLLAGSAPWNQKQFESKGVHLLLQAATRLPWLHLVFLWRGKLLAEMQRLVAKYHLVERVTVLNEEVDVNEVLQNVHAAIVLAEDASMVKAYPHSLLEALAVGRPILVSHCLAISEYASRQHCGLAVRALDLEELLEKISILREKYTFFSARAQQVDPHAFSMESMLGAYQKLYGQILANGNR